MSHPFVFPDDNSRRAVQLLSAILDSADVQIIGATNWWNRAQSALLAGVSGAENAAGVVTIMCQKLQITWAFSKRSSQDVTRIVAEIDGAEFETFVSQVEREAPYMVALTRLYRDERKAQAKADKITAEDIIRDAQKAKESQTPQTGKALF